MKIRKSVMAFSVGGYECELGGTNANLRNLANLFYKIIRVADIFKSVA